MSAKQIIRLSLFGAAGAITLAATANAQNSRYGDIYQYESGRNCGQACVPAQPGRYAAPAPAPMGAPVYVDCTQIGTCAPAQPTTVYSAPTYTQPAPVYTQPAPVYTQPAPTYAQAPANCPAGTTAQPDGTCMQTATTYTTESYSTGTTSYSTGSTMMDCPAGTVAQADGTCMQSGSSSYGTTSTYSTDSYSTDSYSTGSYSSSYSTGSSMADCPAGTVAQADGTCMQGGSTFGGASVELFMGDATTTTDYSYPTTGTTYTSDYRPIRK
jgi:hypothetical protein